MKILFVVNGFPPHSLAGVELYTYGLAKELSKRHQVFIFAREWNINKPEYDIREWRDEKITITSVVKNIGFPADFRASYLDEKIDEMYRLYLKKIKPDIVHFQHAICLSANLIPITTSQKIPTLLTLHDFWFICPSVRMLTPENKICHCLDRDDNGVMCYRANYSMQMTLSPLFSRLPSFIKMLLPQFLKDRIKQIAAQKKNSEIRKKNTEEDANQSRQRREFMTRALNQIDIMISPSQFVKSKFMQFGIAEQKIKVIPHGVTTPKVKIKKNSSPQLRLAYLGTFYSFKGIEILIKSMKKIVNPHIKVEIYGNYKFDQLYYQKIKKLTGKDKRIILKGGYKTSQLPEIMSDIDVVVIPTLAFESFNMVIREAFCYKTPVIASRIGAIPEIMQEGKNGFMFEPGNYEQLAAILEKIIDKRSLVTELQANIPEIKGIEEHGREIESLYTKLSKK